MIRYGERELRAIRPRVPVILCSGAITPELQEEAAQAEIVEVLYKPTSMSKLCESLDRRFAKSASHRGKEDP